GRTAAQPVGHGTKGKGDSHLIGRRLLPTPALPPGPAADVSGEASDLQPERRRSLLDPRRSGCGAALRRGERGARGACARSPDQDGAADHREDRQEEVAIRAIPFKTL